MPGFDKIERVLHRIRAKLYPNYLRNVEGAYIARTDDERSLGPDDVCAALQTRGGHDGSSDPTLVENIREFLDEMVYQLCDGYSINLGYISIHPRIGGAWENALEPFDRKKHPIGFTFRVLKPLRDLTEYIEVFIEGIANTNGFIAEVIDVSTEAVNEVLTPEGMFAVSGHKIKVTGESTDCGVFFVNVASPGQRLRAVGHLAENSASKVIGMLPDLPAGQWQVEIVSQYTGSGSTSLKTPRTIRGTAILTVS
jgi:hypothetical protein